MVGRPSVITENGSSHRTPLALWPKTRENSRSIVKARLAADSKNELPDLLCQGWHIRQNPDFNRLDMTLKKGVDRSLVEDWEHAFCHIGQDSDIVVYTYHFDVRLHRPVCTYLDQRTIQFYYLPGPPMPTYY